MDKVGRTTYNYGYHTEHGFVNSMPHLSIMEWNFKEELVVSSRQVAGQPETTYYQYDSSGKRLRKITEDSAGAPKDMRVYIAGYEYYEEFGGGDITHMLSLIDND